MHFPFPSFRPELLLLWAERWVRKPEPGSAKESPRRRLDWAPYDQQLLVKAEQGFFPLISKKAPKPYYQKSKVKVAVPAPRQLT